MEFNSISQLGKAIQPLPEQQPLVNEGVQNRIEPEKAVENERNIPKAQLEKQIDSLNKFIETSNTHLKFTLHEKLNQYFVQIVDDRTNEVVREVPSRKILDLAAKIQEMIGILVDEKR